jgi:hypothetical protein
MSQQQTVFVFTRKDRKPRDQTRVEQRFAKGLCLNKFLIAPGSTETVDCNRPATRNGNCIACATALDRKCKSLDMQSAIEHKEELIRLGLTLRNQECRQLKQTNVMKIQTA